VVNGEPGLCVRVDGQVTAVLAIDTDGERIFDVYAVVNPEKLDDSSNNSPVQ
jgi:RNA polymerase sigma-70 factor (ECF subfamily)